MKQKVSVLLSEEEWSRLHAYCDVTGHKKSTLVARLIRDHLRAEEFAAQVEIPLTAFESTPQEDSL